MLFFGVFGIIQMGLMCCCCDFFIVFHRCFETHSSGSWNFPLSQRLEATVYMYMTSHREMQLPQQSHSTHRLELIDQRPKTLSGGQKRPGNRKLISESGRTVCISFDFNKELERRSGSRRLSIIYVCPHQSCLFQLQDETTSTLQITSQSKACIFLSIANQLIAC